MRFQSLGVGVVLLSVGLFVLSTSGTLAADTGGKKVTVPANATIFAAGQSEPPDFGGTVPPSVSLSTAESVTFPNITGKVVAGSSFPETGPGGYTRGEIGERELGTDINSYEGISGVIHKNRSLFLVGVFLSDKAPSSPPPDTLDFTDNDSFKTLSPKIGQVFFIGDGRTEDGTVQEFRVPDGATRLYVGFADAYLFKGNPSYYDDNSGKLTVTVSPASRGGNGSAPSPGFGWTVGATALLVGTLILAGRKQHRGE